MDASPLLSQHVVDGECANSMMSALEYDGLPYYYHHGFVVDHAEYGFTIYKGVPIFHEQLWHRYPWLWFMYPFHAEREFNSAPGHDFVKANPTVLPLCICAAYIFLVFWGQQRMASRKQYSLKTPLALWNLSLSVFSFMGASRIIPHLFTNLYFLGFTDSICGVASVNFGQAAAGLWTQLFIYSKIPELVDTLFIVLRKRPLIFLHWYHHVTVLLFCWNSYVTESASGIYFISMNYLVHAVMYFYYFASTMGIWPKCINPICITILQLLQMVVGIFVCAAALYYETALKDDCNVSEENLRWGIIMYASYFALFFKFLLERFVFRRGQSNIKSPKKNAVESIKNLRTVVKCDAPLLKTLMDPSENDVLKQESEGRAAIKCDRQDSSSFDSSDASSDDSISHTLADTSFVVTTTPDGTAHHDEFKQHYSSSTPIKRRASYNAGLTLQTSLPIQRKLTFCADQVLTHRLFASDTMTKKKNGYK